MFYDSLKLLKYVLVIKIIKKNYRAILSSIKTLTMGLHCVCFYKYENGFLSWRQNHGCDNVFLFYCFNCNKIKLLITLVLIKFYNKFKIKTQSLEATNNINVKIHRLQNKRIVSLLRTMWTKLWWVAKNSNEIVLNYFLFFRNTQKFNHVSRVQSTCNLCLKLNSLLSSLSLNDLGEYWSGI